jgi:serine/threonine protein kinase
MNKLLVANQWQLERKLGSGSFGDVYRALNIQTGEYVAIKLEANNTYSPQLAFEARLYRLMKDIYGIPKLFWYNKMKFNSKSN